MDRTQQRQSPPAPVNDGEIRGGRRAFPFELSMDVPADGDGQKTLDVPYDGRIVRVLLGWPQNTDNGVGVSLGMETGTNLIPRNAAEETYMAFNDFSQPFTVRQDVDEDDTIVAEFINIDPDNSHFVNCVVEIVEDGD